jgi:hypothetical protein
LPSCTATQLALRWAPIRQGWRRRRCCTRRPAGALRNLRWAEKKPRHAAGKWQESACSHANEATSEESTHHPLQIRRHLLGVGHDRAPSHWSARRRVEQSPPHRTHQTFNRSVCHKTLPWVNALCCHAVIWNDKTSPAEHLRQSCYNGHTTMFTDRTNTYMQTLTTE